MMRKTPSSPVVRRRPMKRYTLAVETLEGIQELRRSMPILGSDSRVIDWAIDLAVSSLPAGDASPDAPGRP